MNRKLLFLGIVALAAVAAGTWFVWREYRDDLDEVAEAADFPLPGFSETAYLNAGPDATYVGIEACAECHTGRHNSFLHTPHSAALSDLDPAAEPPDGEFRHDLSDRTFRVYREDGQLRHREVVQPKGGDPVVTVDLPVRYLIGSGNFCRSYLVEIDGFLHESPITWYTARKEYDVSPGYDFKRHHGFDRPITHECLSCHAGRVEPKDGAEHKMLIHEQSIGCESCHGPGSVHVEYHRAAERDITGEDLTIVNPSNLSRERLEAVCGVCHQSGVGSVYVRGRTLGDFRPGRPLTDYRIDYRFDVEDDEMAVVGHMEQLRRSPCYKASDMTCLTCHDPHPTGAMDDPVTFYRDKCLECHTEMSCGLEHAERIKRNAADNCVACHMPRGDTDIPHIAFTHHRIGLHTDEPPPPEPVLPDLVPVESDAHLSEIDRTRNLGVAYLKVSDDASYRDYSEAYQKRARKLLDEVYDKGLRDGVLAQELALAYWQVDHRRSGRYAEEALEADDLPPDHRTLALLLRADAHITEGRVDLAIPLLERLVELRRNSEDWRMLAVLYLRSNRPDDAIAAAETGLEIRPYRPDLHAMLADLYGRKGDDAQARDHAEKARQLAAMGQQ